MAVKCILIHKVGDYQLASYGSLVNVSNFILCRISSWLFYNLQFFLAKQIKPRQTRSWNDLTFSYITVLTVSWAAQMKEMNTCWFLARVSGVLQNFPCAPAQLAGAITAFLCTHEEQITNPPCFSKYYPNVTGTVLGICISGTSGTVLYVCLISAALHLCSIPWSQVNSKK